VVTTHQTKNGFDGFPWCVTDRPNSDATLCALRRGIEKYGIPLKIYTDNGREFLFHDFGGRGFRHRKKLEPGEFRPFTILSELGIGFQTAIPRQRPASAWLVFTMRERRSGFSRSEKDFPRKRARVLREWAKYPAGVVAAACRAYLKQETAVYNGGNGKNEKDIVGIMRNMAAQGLCSTEKTPLTGVSGAPKAAIYAGFVEVGEYDF
jgi:hypothetical protein